MPRDFDDEWEDEDDDGCPDCGAGSDEQCDLDCPSWDDDEEDFDDEDDVEFYGVDDEDLDDWDE